MGGAVHTLQQCRRVEMGGALILCNSGGEWGWVGHLYEYPKFCKWHMTVWRQVVVVQLTMTRQPSIKMCTFHFPPLVCILLMHETCFVCFCRGDVALCVAGHALGTNGICGASTYVHAVPTGLNSSGSWVPLFPR